MMVRRDLNTSEEVELSKQLKKGVHIIGMSSYQCFPQPLTNPHDTPRPSFMERHGHHVIAWLHCFRDPHHYIPPSIPSMLLSESDLYRNAETVQSTPRQDISFDFVCSINDGEWNAYIRRLDVAQRWLNYMADEMHLRILVLGCAHSRGFSSRITCEPFLPWRQFLSRLTSARYLFSSSQHDASPRLIVESMLLGLPVLINAHILGGWKYVQPSTGALYHTEDDIQSTITQFMGRVYAPQPWIQDHLRQSQMVCARFLQSVFSLQWSQFIDATIYINLDHRHDRNKAIKQELRAHEISPFHRISATLDERCGHLGCTRSHIRALQLAQSKGWQRVLVLEDDFKWRVPRERALHMVSTFLHRYQHNWDVLMLATAHERLQPADGMVHRVKRSTTASGYLVSAQYLPTLLRNFQESEKLLAQQLDQHPPHTKLFVTRYALDQYWFSLQARDRFYTLEPRLGTQSGSASSIMSRTPVRTGHTSSHPARSVGHRRRRR